jgi:hypothetical protein
MTPLERTFKVGLKFSAAVGARHCKNIGIGDQTRQRSFFESGVIDTLKTAEFHGMNFLRLTGRV